MRWMTTCNVRDDDQSLSFPCEGHGLTEGEQPPLFGSKKVRQMLQFLFYTTSHLQQLRAE